MVLIPTSAAQRSNGHVAGKRLDAPSPYRRTGTTVC